MSDYTVGRTMGFSFAKVAFKVAPPNINSKEYLEQALKDAKTSYQRYKNLSYDGKQGHAEGFREATREHWDKNYRTPIFQGWFETWEIFAHPRRRGYRLTNSKNEFQINRALARLRDDYLQFHGPEITRNSFKKYFGLDVD